MRFWNTAAFGKCLCWMGLLLGAWTMAERLTEASVLAEVSGCTVFRSGASPVLVYSEVKQRTAMWRGRSGDSTVVAYSGGEMRMSCTASYEHDGHAVTARLEARLPSDFDAGRASRRAYVSVSPLNPHAARLTSDPFDWGSLGITVLLLELVGAVLILQGRS